MYSIQSVYAIEDGLLVNAAQRNFGCPYSAITFVSLELQDDGPFHQVSQFQDATTSSGPKCETSAAWSFKFRFVVRVSFILSKLCSALRVGSETSSRSSSWFSSFEIDPKPAVFPPEISLQASLATLIDIQKCQKWNKHETYGLGKLEDMDEINPWGLDKTGCSFNLWWICCDQCHMAVFQCDDMVSKCRAMTSRSKL